MHAMAVPPSVRAIGRAAQGTNNIPVGEMSKRGVPVFNAPGANANAVKELVLAALCSRRATCCPRYRTSPRSTPADRISKGASKDGKKQFAGVELPTGRWGSSDWARSEASSPTPRSRWE
jgi:D-3-phosphoglycerate dehydrogenase